MRVRLLALALMVGLVAVILGPATSLGQGKGGGRGGWGGGGATGGDPNALFDRLSKGRGYFLVSEMFMFRQPLTEFAQQKGITNGQITREMYQAFNEQMKAQFASGGGFKPGSGGGFQGGGGKGNGGFPGGGGFQGGGNAFPKDPAGGGNMDPTQAMNQWAEGEFKRRDFNNDSLLNTDEMPGSLKDDLARWDANKDSLIDLNEYKSYFQARIGFNPGAGDPAKSKDFNPVTILIEEDLERRPTVFRAGNLPKNLPPWFVQLDADKDGQVGLYEWRKGSKEMDEFKLWDRNDDGLITIEEALRYQGIQSAADQKASGSSVGAPPTVINGSDGGKKGIFGGFVKKRS